MPPIRYDESLPIHACRHEIAAAIAASPVVIVSGATGSGKSTQLPKICLEAGRGIAGRIGHTQPRRLAAQALATRLAAELGTPLGDLVGYQVRFVDRTGPRTLVKLMTDGVLLRELEHDPELRRYDTLILDEAHERNLNLDFLLGICQRLVTRRPSLRVIITSATIETQRFAEYFGGAPVIEVAGRSYPVEVRYRGSAPDDETSPTLAESIEAALAELDANSRGIKGDTLVFLPGERQIRETRDWLTRGGLRDRELLPLYSRLSAAEQERIYAAHDRPRIILATNVAETSLTIPGVRFVLDSGLARISRYSPRAKLQRLPIEPVSRASADQRMGRCGREGEGICIRLYTEQDYEGRPQFTEPEIQRTNLASLILQMAALGLGAPDGFPFLDPPDTRLLNDGYRLLSELSAVDGERRITRIGRQMAALPVDPRIARLLIEAAHLGCLGDVLVIASFLSIQDPRERPAEATEAADAAHAEFADPRSDFVAVLNLWRAVREQAEGGPRALRRWCRGRFLSAMRVREWQDLHGQLTDMTHGLLRRTAASEATPQIVERRTGAAARPVAAGDAPDTANPASQRLHRAVLAGFLGGIGVLDENRVYLGARDTRFVIAPGTPLARRTPRWIVAASLVETQRVYARMVAQVQPAWIESAAAHLIRRSYGDAEWLPDQGYVAVRETVSLYGRVLHAGRRIDFATIDPAAARRIFVEEALVLGRGGPDGAFRKRNAAAIAEIERLESKLRRRDLLAGDDAIAAFYLERLPADVTSTRRFDRWWRGEVHQNPGLLDLPRDRLLARRVPEFDPGDFPDALAVAGNSLRLDYRFDPTADDDGVTLTVPLPLLTALPVTRPDWVVPGLLRDKVIAILRGLPKAQRRAIVPVPDAAERFLARTAFAAGSLPEALAEFVTIESGERTSADDIARIPLPPWLRMNLRVVDRTGLEIRVGRDPVLLARELRTEVARASDAVDERWQRDGVRRWDFGDLPGELTVRHAGVTLTMYPGLADVGSTVALRLYPNPSAAAASTRRGVVRLAALALPQQHELVRRSCAADRELGLLAAGNGLGRALYDEIADRAVATAVLGDDALPRTAADFDVRVERGRSAVVGAGEEIARVVHATLAALNDAQAQLGQPASPAVAPARAAIARQIERLIAPGWVRDTADPWFRQLPKYARAVVRRAERLRGEPDRDRRLAAQVEPYERALAALEAGAAGGIGRPRLDEFRWMIEEFRLSLYAQELRTRAPVSSKRLDEQLRRARDEALSGPRTA